jgi:regulator of cell morphogenesis and NO signaling
MSDSASLTPGQWAARHPRTTRVFARHGIDFCCGGRRPLVEICAEQGIALAPLIAELRAAELDPAAGERAWDEAPLPELVDHILTAYHRPLDRDLQGIETMARRVCRVHSAKDPRLAEVLKVYLGLRAELEQHMLKEERILFPMILAGHGAGAGGPISVMEREHDQAAAALRRLRALTDGHIPPPDACTTWRALLAALADFEREMHEHVHLENQMLFPRALAGA